MKKIVCLLMALALCLSMCACGSHSSSEKGGNSKGSDKTIEEQLSGIWYCQNDHYDFGCMLYPDGSMEYPGETWSVSENVVVVTGTDGQGNETRVEYQLYQINGRYVMLGENATYVQQSSEATAGSLAYTQISLTLDNWQDYFECATESEKVFDQFGDETGEVKHFYIVRLKQEYYQRMQESQTEVLVRYLVSGSEANIDDRCLSESCAGKRWYGWYLDEDPAEYPIEMVRIEGTLSLMNLE